MSVLTRIDGVVIGLLMGFADDKPLVVYLQNPKARAQVASSLVKLSPQMVGAKVALLFEGGDPSAPMIVGPVLDAPLETEASGSDEARGGREGAGSDDGRTVIEADERIELRCGRATIILEKNGQVTIRGAEVVSEASGANAVRGASVHLN